MKSFKVLSLMMIAFLISGTIFAQTADEVIAKHIEAIGGKDNWKKVNSIKMEGSLNTQGMDIPIVMYQVHNKALKTEVTVMNMIIQTVITNEGGWIMNPMEGKQAPEPMTADQVKMGQDRLDIQGELIDYASKGHKIEMVGKEDVDGTECYKVKLTRKSGSEATYLIDPKTYYVVKVDTKATVNGQEVNVSATMGNFQKLPEGIVVAHSIQRPEAPAPFNISKIEVNPKIDEAIFKMSK